MRQGNPIRLDDDAEDGSNRANGYGQKRQEKYDKDSITSPCLAQEDCDAEYRKEKVYERENAQER